MNFGKDRDECGGRDHGLVEILLLLRETIKGFILNFPYYRVVQVDVQKVDHIA